VSVQSNDPIGTDFVGYRIEELIGRGGMGVVHRAYDLRLKRTIALKLVAPELALDERFRNRFARETELAMSLEHPNVIPIYDGGDVDGRLYLAMRLIDGPDLRGILRADGALPPERAYAICAQVASALDAAHAKGLVHRDVKPSNVLVDAEDHVYVADLGIGRRLEEASEDRSVGTPAYLAPEEIEGLPVDGRADVYSLGCLLFECLTGEAPFTNDSRLALAWAHLEEEPPAATARNGDLPPAIDGVLAQALAKAPDDRYASCGALMDDAQQALGLRRGVDVRHRRLLLLATMVLAVLLAGAIGFAVLHGRGAAPPLEVRPNTLVRIDPKTNKASDVIDVGKQPVATAVGGDSVWVYNRDAHSLTEVDPRSRATRRTIQLASDPGPVNVGEGPVLAADENGAWLVGVGVNGVGFLTNVRTGVPGDRRVRLGFEPSGVAVGEGAVWVIGVKGTRGELVRVDPRRRIITAHKLLPPPAVLDSVTTGFGAVFGVDAARGRLYKIDPRSLELGRRLDFGPSPGRPWTAFGDVWVAYLGGPASKGILVDPKTLTPHGSLSCCPPREGGSTHGFGSTWTVNWPSGTVVRWSGLTKQPVGDIHLTGDPDFGAPCLTSIAAGAGSVWVTVGPNSQIGCPV
jgi:serine/threonine-protein kinase